MQWSPCIVILIRCGIDVASSFCSALQRSRRGKSSEYATEAAKRTAEAKDAAQATAEAAAAAAHATALAQQAAVAAAEQFYLP